MDHCELCQREAQTTEHHLVPRSRKGERGVKFGPTARLCRDCHRTVHATWDNRTLARQYATLAKLRSAPELAPYLAFIRKQPGTALVVVRKRKR